MTNPATDGRTSTRCQPVGSLEFVNESDSEFHLTNCEFINYFKAMCYIYPQFVIRYFGIDSFTTSWQREIGQPAQGSVSGEPVTCKPSIRTLHFATSLTQP